MAATITLDLGDYEAKRAHTLELEQRVLDLTKQLDQAKLGAITGPSAPALLGALRSALAVARFAVANLHPETVRGWPHAELTSFGEALKELPGLSPHEREVGDVFVVFAREAAQLEKERALGIHKERERRTLDGAAPKPVSPEGAAALANLGSPRAE